MVCPKVVAKYILVRIHESDGNVVWKSKTENETLDIVGVIMFWEAISFFFFLEF